MNVGLSAYLVCEEVCAERRVLCEVLGQDQVDGFQTELNRYLCSQPSSCPLQQKHRASRNVGRTRSGARALEIARTQLRLAPPLLRRHIPPSFLFESSPTSTSWLL